jgi:DNA-binding NarL/FixJ family response regulator
MPRPDEQQWQGFSAQKVLIVDDNSLFRAILRKSLQSRCASLVIYEASDGREALEQVITSNPTLIFMDIQLPDRNGLEVARLIKQVNPEAEIVVLTSYDQVEYRAAAIKSKVDHFASKDSFMLLIDIIFLRSPSR